MEIQKRMKMTKSNENKKLENASAANAEEANNSWTTWWPTKQQSARLNTTDGATNEHQIIKSVNNTIIDVLGLSFWQFEAAAHS